MKQVVLILIAALAISCAGGAESPTASTPTPTSTPTPIPAPAPTPTSTFNGTYTGNATDGDDREDPLDLTMTVANGVVSFMVGSDVAPGTVSGSGALTASGGRCNGTMTGQITLTSSGGATATGTWSHPTTPDDVCGPANSGTWTATR